MQKAFDGLLDIGGAVLRVGIQKASDAALPVVRDAGGPTMGLAEVVNDTLIRGGRWTFTGEPMVKDVAQTGDVIKDLTPGSQFGDCGTEPVEPGTGEGSLGDDPVFARKPELVDLEPAVVLPHHAADEALDLRQPGTDLGRSGGAVGGCPLWEGHPYVAGFFEGREGFDNCSQCRVPILSNDVL